MNIRHEFCLLLFSTGDGSAAKLSAGHLFAKQCVGAVCREAVQFLLLTQSENDRAFIYALTSPVEKRFALELPWPTQSQEGCVAQGLAGLPAQKPSLGAQRDLKNYVQAAVV